MSQDARSPLDLAGRLALRPAEAARVLGVSERWIRQNLRRLPVVREGGVVLIPTDSLREWLRRRARVECERLEATVQEALEAVGARSKRG